MLSEEGADDKARLHADRVWIVDPLDGTREFSEPPRDDWAVHVALWAGPAATWSPGPSPSPRSARRSARPRRPSYPTARSDRPRIAVSRTRPPAFVEALAAELGADLVPMGSAGVKVISVVRDVTDAYVHAGGQYEWDKAAPVAVARVGRAVLLAGRRLRAPLQPGRRVPPGPHRLPARAVRGDRRLRPAARNRLDARPRTHWQEAPLGAR